MRKSQVNQLMKRLMKPLAIPLSHQKMMAKRLVAAVSLGNYRLVAQWVVISAALFSVVGVMLPATVFAVGLGGINVTSALGQTLKADIELGAISKTEKDSLVARLASPEAYKNAGLEYPYGNKFKLQVENRADGQPYIKASSAQPVNEPFVSLLVELSWSSGKLSREYTFLLDPPGYVSEQPVPTPVQAVVPAVQAAAPEVQAVTPEVKIAPKVQATPPAVTSSSAPAAAEETVPVPMEDAVEKAAPAAAPEQQAAASQVVSTEPAKTAPPPTTEVAVAATAEAAAVQENKEWLAVRRGDTIRKIAEQYKPTGVSVERMLVAMYHINADQFDGRNMNRIKAGKILHLPSQQDVANVSLPEAVKEIHAQAADWNAYRQKLASAATLSNSSTAARQVTSGKISSSVTDMAPVAKESAKEVLKLSKGEAPQDRVSSGAGGKSMSAQDKKNAAQENAVAEKKALKEGQERTALLEKNLQDMQRLAQLKAPLKAETAVVAQLPATAKIAASEVAATSAVKPTPATPSKRKQVKSEPSLLDQIREEPLYLAAGAGALLILGGLGFVLYRRKHKKQKSGESITDFIQDVGSTSSRIAAPVFPSPDTGDFTRVSATKTVAPPQSEHVDPISEADLFLNFGRDVQAEAILKEALQNTPDNHQISLKLLGIYANRKDVHSFSSIARQLQNSGDAEAWQQAAVMGRKLEPNNPMYSGAGTIEDAGNATMQMTAFDVVPPKNVAQTSASVVDFDLDVGASTTSHVSLLEQNFLSGADKTSIMSAGGGHAPQVAEMDFDLTSSKDSSLPESAGAMDFDITSTSPSMRATKGSEADSPIVDELDFDVTSNHLFMPAEPQAKNKPADTEDDGMTFTLDFPVEQSTEKSAPAQPVGLAGINLNFDDATPSGSATENKDDHWQEVATKLDLAKAYQEMGDASGAREILEEVVREGDAEQRAAAQNLIQQLG